MSTSRTTDKPRISPPLRLQGVHEIYNPDDGIALERCTLTKATGSTPAVFIAAWMEDGHLWELKLTSSDGVLFEGSMTAKGWGVTKAAMTLWSTAAGDRWLMDGTFGSTEGQQRWMLTLGADDL